MPRELDPAEVETLVVNGVTAWQMLHRSARVRQGDRRALDGPGRRVCNRRRIRIVETIATSQAAVPDITDEH